MSYNWDSVSWPTLHAKATQFVKLINKLNTYDFTYDVYAEELIPTTLF